MLPRQEQPSRAERSTPPYLSRSLCALTLFVAGAQEQSDQRQHNERVCWPFGASVLAEGA